MSEQLQSHGSKNIVLLGIGHTNAHIVRQWASDPIPGYQLICISTFPNATYSGMLPGALGGQFSDDAMRIDLAALAERADARLVLADTNGLDLPNRKLFFSGREPIAFEALSIGVGSMPAGWQQHAHSPLVVPIKPMQTFLNRLEERWRASQLSKGRTTQVAIVGGGVAGVEIALCLQQHFHQPGSQTAARDHQLSLYTSSLHVADGMSPRSVGRLERLLKRRGITVHRNQRVSEVGMTHLATDDGHRHASDCVIWATGAAPPPVLGTLGLQTDAQGFVATTNTLQSLSDSRIFAVGDSGTVLASPSVKAGVYAVRQAPVLWYNLRALFENRPMQVFKPQGDFLKILNTGDGRALLQYGWLTVHARWCLTLKTWIDKSFIRKYQTAQRNTNTRAE